MIQAKLDRRFKNRLAGRLERYSFQVGVLVDGPHKLPRRGARGKGGRDVQGTYAGGPIRKKSARNSGLTIAQVSKETREKTGVNYLTEPFKKSRSSEALKFVSQFFRVVTGASQPKRLENLLQAVVRNPILRGEYGGNSILAKRIKGFDRLMIDTGQLFRAITAKVIRKATTRV